MKMRLLHGLPFVSVSVIYQGRRLDVGNVLVDTGSMGTIFPADLLASFGIMPGHDALAWTVRGIGGIESVIAQQVDGLECGEISTGPFEIEIGMADYGFDIQGILGMDFLTSVGAVVDLARLELRAGEASS
jgi:hypothetical protein